MTGGISVRSTIVVRLSEVSKFSLVVKVTKTTVNNDV